MACGRKPFEFKKNVLLKGLIYSTYYIITDKVIGGLVEAYVRVGPVLRLHVCAACELEILRLTMSLEVEKIDGIAFPDQSILVPTLLLASCMMHIVLTYTEAWKILDNRFS